MGVYLKGVTKEQLWKVIINSTEFLPDYCEIVEVKTPHGRLIDADEVEVQAELMQKVNMKDRGFMDIALAFAVAPAVIEAEVE